MYFGIVKFYLEIAALTSFFFSFVLVVSYHYYDYYCYYYFNLNSQIYSHFPSYANNALRRHLRI